MEILLLTKNRCGWRMGNRKFIWSDLSYVGAAKLNFDFQESTNKPPMHIRLGASPN